MTRIWIMHPTATDFKADASYRKPGIHIQQLSASRLAILSFGTGIRPIFTLTLPPRVPSEVCRHIEKQAVELEQLHVQAHYSRGRHEAHQSHGSIYPNRLVANMLGSLTTFALSGIAICTGAFASFNAAKCQHPTRNAKSGRWCCGNAQTLFSHCTFTSHCAIALESISPSTSAIRSTDHLPTQALHQACRLQIRARFSHWRTRSSFRRTLRVAGSLFAKHSITFTATEFHLHYDLHLHQRRWRCVLLVVRSHLWTDTM
ncbi:hypothetical protein EJ03DRAFT_81425 [Teratosphaeria nubilosa]|uniref:Uncharacterized protein n=1 Tax=Teratosphaeria nubilosa TaxID=161662 RepID=A0A6G1LB50_9PEZI|nr:hypothetical protein EJ03DRAFT_81425 [Teratosphaeria nubilosa]